MFYAFFLLISKIYVNIIKIINYKKIIHKNTCNFSKKEKNFFKYILSL